MGHDEIRVVNEHIDRRGRSRFVFALRRNGFKGNQSAVQIEKHEYHPRGCERRIVFCHDPGGQGTVPVAGCNHRPGTAAVPKSQHGRALF